MHGRPLTHPVCSQCENVALHIGPCLDGTELRVASQLGTVDVLVWSRGYLEHCRMCSSILAFTY